MCGYEIASNSTSVIYFTCFLLAFNFDQTVCWPARWYCTLFRFQIQLINCYFSFSVCAVVVVVCLLFTLYSLFFHGILLRVLIKNLVSMFKLCFTIKYSNIYQRLYCSRLHHQNAKQFFKCIVQSDVGVATAACFCWCDSSVSVYGKYVVCVCVCSCPQNCNFYMW